MPLRSRVHSRLAGTVLTIAALGPAPGPVFFRVTDSGPAVTDSIVAGAGALVDLDADGDLDIYTGFQANRYYRNEGGGVFAAITTGDFVTNVPGIAYGGGIFADYDEDGDLDLYRGVLGDVLPNGFITDRRPDRLYRNDGPDGLVHVPLAGDSTIMNSASWVDADRDGDLDIFVAGIDETDLFYRNEGDGAFTQRQDLPFINVTDGVGSNDVWIDLDLDGDEDLYVANIGRPNELYRNLWTESRQRLSFEKITTSPLTAEGNIFDIAGVFGDYDNDGDPDVFLPVAVNDFDRLYRNEGGGTFVRILSGDPVASRTHATAASWGDADNDGDLDLFVPQVFQTALPSLYYRNDGDLGLVRVLVGMGDLTAPLGGPSAAQWADVDDDGDLDVYVVTIRDPNFVGGDPAPNVLFRNEGPSVNHWLRVSCEGTSSNRSAIGTRIEVTATILDEEIRQTRWVSGSGVSYLFQAPYRQHFGLGNATVADTVRVVWPIGTVETLTDVAADQTLHLVEPIAVEIGDDPPRVPRPRVRAVPNPTRGATTIHFEGAGAGPVAVEIFDAAGRRVRTLPGGAVPLDGGSSVTWDGRDEEGRPVVPGAYFLRARFERPSGAMEGVGKVRLVP